MSLSTGDTLLRAIIDHPEDDLPRRAYADWLEEQGQPERAELIRLQLEMAKLAPDEDTAPNEWECPRDWELDRRCDQLLEAHHTEWFGKIESLVEHHQIDRGFVEYIDVGARQFAQWAEEIFAAAPTIHQVYLDQIGRNMPAVARRPELGRL